MNQWRSVPSCLPEKLKKVEPFQPLLNSWPRSPGSNKPSVQVSALLHFYNIHIRDLTSQTWPSFRFSIPLPPGLNVPELGAFFMGSSLKPLLFSRGFSWGFYGWSWFFLCSWWKWWKRVIAYLGGVCLADEADHRETGLCCFNRKLSVSEEELAIQDDLQ